MLGLNMFYFIDINNIDFYRVHKALAMKMGVLDLLPRNYLHEVVEGEGNTFDRVRRDVSTPLVWPCYKEPMVMLHPDGSSRGARGDEKEEEEAVEEEVEEDQTMDDGDKRLEEDVGIIAHMQ